MDEIHKTELSDQTKLRSDEIKKIENCLTQKLIKENYVLQN